MILRSEIKLLTQIKQISLNLLEIDRKTKTRGKCLVHSVSLNKPVQCYLTMRSSNSGGGYCRFIRSEVSKFSLRCCNSGTGAILGWPDPKFPSSPWEFPILGWGIPGQLRFEVPKQFQIIPTLPPRLGSSLWEIRNFGSDQPIIPLPPRIGTS